jgi:replicative DNA helicase
MSRVSREAKKINITEKLLPHAIELEEAVLGAIILEKDSILEVLDILKPESFYKAEHKYVYEAILNLNNESLPIDMLTVTQQLLKEKTSSLVGGPYFISQLTNRVSSAANIEFHARIIKEKQIARDLINLSSEIINDSFDESKDILKVSERLMAESFNIGEIKEGKSFSSNTELLRELRKNIETAKEHSGITGITTGIEKKDQLFGGYQKTHLIIKAGRPAMGKSADALSEADFMALNGHKVLFFSLEMSARELMQRRVSVRSGIPLYKMKNGTMTQDDWKIYNEATSDMYEDGLTIIDIPGLSLNAFKKISKKHKLKHGLDAIFVDYLQLMTHNVGNGNREQEISSISRGLKTTAKELNVPLIALAQLSRAVESRGGAKKPILADLRESGSIEQDADIVQFLYRPEYYKITEDENGNSTVGKGWMIVAKNRHGDIRDIEMKFIGECTKFDNWIDEPLSNIYNPNIGINPNTNFHNSSQDIKESKNDWLDTDNHSPF